MCGRPDCQIEMSSFAEAAEDGVLGCVSAATGSRPKQSSKAEATELAPKNRRCPSVETTAGRGVFFCLHSLVRLSSGGLGLIQREVRRAGFARRSKLHVCLTRCDPPPRPADFCAGRYGRSVPLPFSLAPWAGESTPGL
jgi:hypothetical protein